jgi:Uma2 family endonuclease
MTDNPEANGGMSLEEFIATGDERFELVAGARVPLLPYLAGQCWVISEVLAAVVTWEQGYTGHGIFLPNCTYVRLDANDRVMDARVPDIGFLTAARWENYLATTPDWGVKPLVLVPDLCVEVISKNDFFGDVQRKAALYLEDGVSEVWVVSPDDQSVLVYTAGSKTIARLTAEDTLSSPLLPDFALPVVSLFPG